MFTSSNRRAGAAIVFCFALAAAACGGDDSPAAPSTPTPDPEPVVTLTGTWTGPVDGVLVDGDARAELTQTGTNVTGDWSMPMPAALVLVGAPADVPLTGPVTGTVSGTTAALTFGFLAAYADYFGSADCAITVTVTSFSQTMMEATWTTNESCQAPAVDEGTLTFTRQ